MRPDRRPHRQCVHPLLCLKPLLNQPTLSVSIQPQTNGRRRQPPKGIILSQQQPELRSARKQPIRLVHPSAHQIINQHPNHRLVSAKNHWFSNFKRKKRSVQSRHSPLASRLLIPRGAVDLTSKVQPLQRLDRQRAVQLRRRKVVVLDGVTGTGHLHPLKPRHRPQVLELHLRRQGGREPVDVHLPRVQPLRLQEHLMPLRMRKPDDLVLDARTVPRTPPADRAPVESGTLQVGGDDLLKTGGGPRKIAWELHLQLR